MLTYMFIVISMFQSKYILFSQIIVCRYYNRPDFVGVTQEVPNRRILINQRHFRVIHCVDVN